MPTLLGLSFIANHPVLVFFVAFFATFSLVNFYESWVKRSRAAGNVARTILPGSILLAAFAALAAIGAWDYFVIGHATFLNLSVFLIGAVGAGELASRLFGWRKAEETDEAEMRRVSARDL